MSCKFSVIFNGGGIWCATPTAGATLCRTRGRLFQFFLFWLICGICSIDRSQYEFRNVFTAKKEIVFNPTNYKCRETLLSESDWKKNPNRETYLVCIIQWFIFLMQKSYKYCQAILCLNMLDIFGLRRSQIQNIIAMLSIIS